MEKLLFADLEGGFTTSPQALWHSSQELHHALPPPPDRIEEVPGTLIEVERQLHKTATGKAVGLDQLPGELVKLTTAWLASAIWPLVAKAALWADEPLQHKGGRSEDLL